MAAWGILAVLLGLGCSQDQTRHLGPGEALRYKRQLLQQNPRALTVEQQDVFGQYRARTKASIDGVFARLKRQRANRAAADQAGAGTRASGFGNMEDGILQDGGATSSAAEP